MVGISARRVQLRGLNRNPGGHDHRRYMFVLIIVYGRDSWGYGGGLGESSDHTSVGVEKQRSLLGIF